MNTNQKHHCHPILEKEEAIRNLGGMVWLYEKHLLKFRNTYADSAAVTREYLLHGKNGEAQILIHSIKGLAGTLGLRQLYYAAANLELAIKTTDDTIGIYLNNYESCLTEALIISAKD